jgi:hypothetical protein
VKFTFCRLVIHMLARRFPSLFFVNTFFLVLTINGICSKCACFAICSPLARSPLQWLSLERVFPLFDTKGGGGLHAPIREGCVKGGLPGPYHMQLRSTKYDIRYDFSGSKINAKRKNLLLASTRSAKNGYGWQQNLSIKLFFAIAPSLFRKAMSKYPNFW